MGNFMTTLTRQANRLAMKMVKISPEIMIVAGVVGTIAGTVMACKATAKAQTELKADFDELDRIEEFKKKNDDLPAEQKMDYSVADYNDDRNKVRARIAVKAVRLYAPAVSVTAASLASIIFSHRILCKRNIGLAAAYAALDKGFKEYRSRVVDKLGDEQDKKFRYGFEDKVIEVETEDESGNKVTETKVVQSVVDLPETGDSTYSIYARFFDESSPNWEKSPEYNLSFLRGCESMANAKLKAKGYLFLNDVYEMLGLERSAAGQVVGWIYDPSDPFRDNYVDFGIYNDIERPRNRAFVNGYERSILLDFNVDGDILSEM